MSRTIHDDRLNPCPLCGSEPWVDTGSFTVYCECGLSYHMNGKVSPYWHRADFTIYEWNRLAVSK